MKVYHVSLLGHKDHGKSTLIGALLMQTHTATNARIKEAEVYSKKLHKDFEPAFILDSFAEERINEMTIDTTRAEITYKGVAFSLIDVPGHEELIKNMISGASYGEIAILLVSAKPEEGIRPQTKRHLYLAKMLGINRLIVAVNKMDLVGYDEHKFDSIKSDLGPFIKKIGFEENNVYFVPISAYKGENLIKKSSKMKWYTGKSIIELLYKNSIEDKTSSAKPLRIILQGRIPYGDKEMVVGKIISGTVKIGERVRLLPSDTVVVIKEVIVKGKKTKKASAHEDVALYFNAKPHNEVRGSIISGSSNAPELKNVIKARIFVAASFGKRMRIRFNGVDIDCSEIKVYSRIDTTTGEKKPSKSAKALEAVEAEIRLKKRIPVENYNKTKELGRFVLYDGDDFSGIGIVEE